jgi:hypothetical protein
VTVDSGPVLVTEEMRRQQRRRARRARVRFALVCAWGRTGYRPWARLLHRAGLHHTRSGYAEHGDRWVRCDWCGISGITHYAGSIGVDTERDGHQ